MRAVLSSSFSSCWWISSSGYVSMLLVMQSRLEKSFTFFREVTSVPFNIIHPLPSHEKKNAKNDTLIAHTNTTNRHTTRSIAASFIMLGKKGFYVLYERDADVLAAALCWLCGTFSSISLKVISGVWERGSVRNFRGTEKNENSASGERWRNFLCHLSFFLRDEVNGRKMWWLVHLAVMLRCNCQKTISTQHDAHSTIMSEASNLKVIVRRLR